MQTNNNTQLGLFQFTAPAGNLSRFLIPKTQEKDGKTVGISTQLMKRKEIAAALGLSVKKDADQLNAEVLKLTDELKSNISREVAGIAASQNWTGGKLSIRTNKQGMRRVTCSFVEVVRQSNAPSDEQVAKLLGLSLDEVRELREQAVKANKPTEVEVTLEETTAATA